jgi:uncharacterized sulfatase
MLGDLLLCLEDNKKQEVYVQISECFVGRAIRTGRYTYCVHALDKHPVHDSGSDVYRDRALFDNEKDPLQKNNLIGDPGYGEIKEDLRKRLIACAETAGEGIIKIC